jgi:hypothetical protein
VLPKKTTEQRSFRMVEPFLARCLFREKLGRGSRAPSPKKRGLSFFVLLHERRRTGGCPTPDAGA